MSNTSVAPTLSHTPHALGDALAQIVERERVLTRPIERIAYAADASFYRLIPQAVVLAKGVEEVQGLFRFSRTQRVPMTFRAGGTSLSGQAVTDGILVEVSRYWREVRVEEGGRKVRVQPWVIGGHVNQALKAYRAKMGPDPASINACMMGGILANSLGLLSDAAHNLSDVVALGLSLWAVRLGRRSATPRRTFAYKRAEILVAMFNSAVLVAISVYIIVEAARRLLHPEQVHGL